MSTKLLPLSLIAALALQSAYAESTVELDPIVVSSDFREKKLSETNNAVTVIGEEQIYGNCRECCQCELLSRWFKIKIYPDKRYG